MVKEKLSGFKKEGTWDEIVDYGELVTDILDDEGVEGEDFEEWDSWRPRSEEGLGDEMRRKTAEKGSIGYEEKAEFKEAGKKLFSKFEEAVYEKVMGKVGHQYFDNDLISAHIERISSKLTGKKPDEDQYLLEIDVHPSKLKDEVREVLLGRD